MNTINQKAFNSSIMQQTLASQSDTFNTIAIILPKFYEFSPFMHFKHF